MNTQGLKNVKNELQNNNEDLKERKDKLSNINTKASSLVSATSDFA